MNKFNLLGNIMLELGIIIISVSVHFRIDRLEKAILKPNVSLKDSITSINGTTIVGVGEITVTGGGIDTPISVRKDINKITVKVIPLGNDTDWYWVWYNGDVKLAMSRNEIRPILERMKTRTPITINNQRFADSITKVLNEYE